MVYVLLGSRENLLKGVWARNDACRETLQVARRGVLGGGRSNIGEGQDLYRNGRPKGSILLGKYLRSLMKKEGRSRDQKAQVDPSEVIFDARHHKKKAFRGTAGHKVRQARAFSLCGACGSIGGWRRERGDQN